MSPLTVTVRRGTPDDADTLGGIMFDAIRTGESPYTDAQRAAWLPTPNRGASWQARLASQYVIVAEGASSPVGFMTLTPQGYIDLAYILPQARGQGVFGQLLREIEKVARRTGLATLTTHASLMADPAFARHGYVVNIRETVTRDGETLRRAEMSRNLSET